MIKTCVRTCWVTLALGLTACGGDDNQKSEPKPQASPTPEPTPEPEPKPEVPTPFFLDPLGKDFKLDDTGKARWMEKASARIRGRGTSADEAAMWEALSHQEIVKQLVNDETFVDTTIKFGLFYLGVPRDSIRSNSGAYNDEIFDYPSAIAAASSLQGKGDFLALTRLEQPNFLPALESPSIPFDPDNPDADLPPIDELRAGYRQDAFDAVKRVQDYLAGTEFDREGMCGILFDGDNGNLVPFFGGSHFDNYGAPESITSAMGNAPEWFGGLLLWCFLPDSSSITKEDLTARFIRIEQRLPELFSLLDALGESGEPITDLDQLQIADFTSIGIPNPQTFTANGLFRHLSNSSTNFSRKRAAFVLKRYFCDDLTPINIVAPEDHGQGAHASEASCQSCHFKLDPMAGFFKEKGFNGLDFSGAAQIVFDDGATVDKAVYQSSWQRDDGSWNIGFVRSSRDRSVNIYGENLEDLFTIIESAPEVRQCLVRRLFEYYVAEDQVIDGGYLDFLTAKFNEETTKKDATYAYKRIVQRLLLSNTFREEDPNSKVCYDQAEHARGGPCEISFVLDKYCSSCHSTNSAAGGLDVTTWVEIDGQFALKHERDGQQLSFADSMGAILDRLTTTDDVLRMPQNMEMPAAERDQLYLWVYDALNQQEN